MAMVLAQDPRGAAVRGLHHSVITANPFDWSKLIPQLPVVPSLLQEQADSVSGAEATAAVPARIACTVTSAAAAQDRSARLVMVQSQVMAAVSDVLGSDVGADDPLMDAGLDSLGAVELKNTI